MFKCFSSASFLLFFHRSFFSLSDAKKRAFTRKKKFVSGDKLQKLSFRFFYDQSWMLMHIFELQKHFQYFLLHETFIEENFNKSTRWEMWRAMWMGREMEKNLIDIVDVNLHESNAHVQMNKCTVCKWKSGNFGIWKSFYWNNWLSFISYICFYPTFHIKISKRMVFCNYFGYFWNYFKQVFKEKLLKALQYLWFFHFLTSNCSFYALFLFWYILWMFS